MGIGPDKPEPNDWTARRLKAVEAFGQWLPGWRGVLGELGEVRRDGWHVGWLDPATPPAEARLAG